MTTLLLIVAILLSLALVTVLLKLRRLQRYIPEQIEEEIEIAIKQFKKRSGRTRVGTTVEQMVPFVKDFPYDPSDARIISGGPIDYVIFDGLCDGKVRELVFLDVKTGGARTNAAQKQVQECADLGLVRFAVFEVDATGRTRTRLSTQAARTHPLARDLPPDEDAARHPDGGASLGHDPGG